MYVRIHTGEKQNKTEKFVIIIKFVIFYECDQSIFYFLMYTIDTKYWFYLNHPNEVNGNNCCGHKSLKPHLRWRFLIKKLVIAIQIRSKTLFTQFLKQSDFQKKLFSGILHGNWTRKKIIWESKIFRPETRKAISRTVSPRFFKINIFSPPIWNFYSFHNDHFSRN